MINKDNSERAGDRSRTNTRAGRLRLELGEKRARVSAIKPFCGASGSTGRKRKDERKEEGKTGRKDLNNLECFLTPD